MALWTAFPVPHFLLNLTVLPLPSNTMGSDYASFSSAQSFHHSHLQPSSTYFYHEDAHSNFLRNQPPSWFTDATYYNSSIACNIDAQDILSFLTMLSINLIFTNNCSDDVMWLV
jgi:hypothetical protein